ncbi:MAG: hypothetical protein H0V88_11045 [Pyrinomonadaceae bacterium]|nr:hypothetical protein [Pyrinomonadaceae bacterium]
MKHITSRIVIALLTFIIGTAAAFWFYQSTSSKRCAYDNYFPVGAFSQSDRKVEWITQFYSAMMESPLSCLDEDTEAYRFLFLPSFEPPASVRIWREGDQKYIEVKQLSSVGLPQYGAKDLKVNVTRSITEQEWDRFQELLRKTNFWSMPTEDGRIGLDGASFLLEGYKSGQHHVVNRWLPEDQNYLDACSYLLEISRLEMGK